MLILLNIKFISLVRQNSVTFSLMLYTCENIRESALLACIKKTLMFLIFGCQLTEVPCSRLAHSTSPRQIVLTPVNQSFPF